MKIPFQSHGKPARFFRVALSLAMTLAGYGALVMPAVAVVMPVTSAAAVTENPVVDQQPLTVQPPIPPNIVLMLDDSGSMSWNFMPDFDYLQNNGNNDALIDSANNGLYYNPAETYTPPPHADGTSFTNQTDMTNVPEDGFGVRTTADVSLFNYGGSYDFHDCGGVCGGSDIDYNVNNPTTTVTNNVNSSSDCRDLQTQQGADSRSYSSSRNRCTLTFNHYFFQYSTGPAAGPYVVHYVAATSADCANAPDPANCVAATDTSGVAAPSGVAVNTNVANWFAYYHTRILTAKSGLMNGFADMNPDYRLGFASIDGSGASWIDSNITDVYDFSTSTKSDNRLAEVAVFGDGSTGTRKAQFWDWITEINPGNSTPLRGALKGAGEYYSTEQPWSTMSTDPNYGTSSANTDLACRQAYTVLTTDGFWNGAIPSGIGNADGTAGTTVTGPNSQTYTYSPAAPYSGGDPASGAGDPSLADVAMHYWDTDLRPTLDNEVPASVGVDPAFWQHMTTFTMGMGFVPENISPAGTTVDQIFAWADGGTAISGFSWPTPQGSGGSGGSINNIADLAHAAVNGHGAFFSATSAQAFSAGIQAALKRVANQNGTGASLSSNSTQLVTGTAVYQAFYNTSPWTGELEALAVDSSNGATSSTPLWSASQEMPSAASRAIETWNPSTSTFVPFVNGSGTPPSLSTAQLAALGSTASDQETMVDYLRGDVTGEQRNGGAFRNRVKPDGSTDVLGDLVSSQPIYSGPPNTAEFNNQSFLGNIVDSSTNTVPFFDWAVGTTDSSGTFTASAASTRTALVFVASNDGMLHAFNAGNYNSTTQQYDSGTGAEVYAYLPGAVITAGLKDLADPDYGGTVSHQYFNDGQLTIADAYIDTGDGNGQSWHTILVGTTGRGLAKAVYALDVTDPANITPLWERSADDGLTNSNYIGQMAGKPVIAQTDYTPVSGTTPASSSWSVLMGNGYNSAAGVAALLQFDLATGALTVHTTTDSTAGNGLAGPLAWMDNTGNGVSDIAYAGDLRGNVWSFALNDTTGSNPTPTSTGSLLFVAKDAGGTRQPITADMLTGKDPATGDVWLFFGTGEYLNSADLANTDVQTWYGIIVQSSTSSLVSNLTNGRSALVQRTITAETAGGGSVLPARSVSAEVTNADGTTDMTGKSGWYLDLEIPDGSGGFTPQGERMIERNEFVGNLLVGVTLIPQISDFCNLSGTGWIMALDPFTGTASSSDFFDVNGDSSINSGDRVGGSVAAGIGFTSAPHLPTVIGNVMEVVLYNGTRSNPLISGATGAAKRVSWRELVNP